MYKITIQPGNRIMEAREGETLLSVQIRAGLRPDAPCGGQGSCGKCLVDILEEPTDPKESPGSNASGETVLACQYEIHQDLTIRVREKNRFHILENGIKRQITVAPQVTEGYGAAFDIGTTSVVCYLLDLKDGTLIGRASMLNPQSQFGADVISRCEYAMAHGVETLSSVIRSALNELIQTTCGKHGIRPEQIRLVTVVGNTCMHHLFLNIDPRPLTVVPYEAAVKDEIEMPASEADLHVHPEGVLQILPNIAGFVGADTVGCVLASSFDSLGELSLMIDIGTNGEMVMGNKDRMIACSTAAGPAFEGAKIECGMRGTEGAIDHVRLENGKLICHIIGDDREVDDAIGICGSGLMDAVAAALDGEIIDESGRIDTDCECVFLQPESGQPAIRLTETVYLSQKDIREVQLAKGAVAAGIELLAETLGIQIHDLRRVMIAGAFGNYMDPHSACRIGMIPAELEDRIEMIGNAAGEGSIIATLNYEEFLHAQQVRETTEFLELASSPDFQDTFVDHLLFDEA